MEKLAGLTWKGIYRILSTIKQFHKKGLLKAIPKTSPIKADEPQWRQKRGIYRRLWDRLETALCSCSQFNANNNPQFGVQRGRKLYSVQNISIVIQQALLWKQHSCEAALGPGQSWDQASLAGQLCSALLRHLWYFSSTREIVVSLPWRGKVCSQSRTWLI